MTGERIVTIRVTEAELLAIDEALRSVSSRGGYDDGYLKLFRGLRARLDPVIRGTRIMRDRRAQYAEAVRIVRIGEESASSTARRSRR